jgi:hypothetical protein
MLDGATSKIEILNMRGVRVQSIPLDMKNTGKVSAVSVSLEPLADGLYVMRITNGNKRNVTIPVSVVGR